MEFYQQCLIKVARTYKFACWIYFRVAPFGKKDFIDFLDFGILHDK